jgi:hypothetical protein
MARQMGGARKVYITQLGRPTAWADLVPTFAATTVNALGTVEEQDEYHARWLESLLQQRRD